ncbi:hypothetical protein NW755_013584 [Fusarium falciforme]|uniref:Alginate lyase domain-containing protein n=1 Tax=Fusarium falciforme TaxID=195108 RepID=A0A9W8UVG4_9HYPO|nr:hypothetical protein NW755_013584 [Fusarium falciforme]
MLFLALLASSGALALPTCSETISKAGFTHPGVLHSCSDLERIQRLKSLEKEPWVSAWQSVDDLAVFQSDYQMRGPLDWIAREPANQTHHFIHDDGRSAYYSAVAWFATGKDIWLDRSISIIRAWAKELNVLRDYIYGGTGMHHMSAAAEILRAASGSGWSDKDTRDYVAMYKRISSDWRQFDNFSLGLDQDTMFGNQGILSNLGLLGLAVFSEDAEVYDRVIERATYGRSQHPNDDWALNRFVNNKTDQLTESGRDQAHAALFVTGMSLMAETLNIQGQVGDRYPNLYEWGNNMPLKRAMLYWINYNVGKNVPYQPLYNVENGRNYLEISPLYRGRLTGRDKPDTFLAPPYYYYSIHGGLSPAQLNSVKRFLEYSGPAYENAFWGDDAVADIVYGPKPTEGGAYLHVAEGSAKKVAHDKGYYGSLGAKTIVTYSGNVFQRSIKSQPNVGIRARTKGSDAHIIVRNGTLDGFVVAEGTVSGESFKDYTWPLKGQGDFTYNASTR